MWVIGHGLWNSRATFAADAEGVEFRQSNFGILGLRVAKRLSVAFGNGRIMGADGQTGEHGLFGRPNRWIDYSGSPGKTASGHEIREGVTLLDHVNNPGHGSDAWASWHVRDDGWIGPSLTRHGPLWIQPGKALTCRYQLLVHPGECDPQACNQLADAFDAAPSLSLVASSRPHVRWEIAG